MSASTSSPQADSGYDVKGLYTEWPRLQVADSGRFKALTGGWRPLQDEKSEHFLRWACCRNLQVAASCAGAHQVESGEGIGNSASH